jgi:hypothetical protein
MSFKKGIQIESKQYLEKSGRRWKKYWY